MFEEVKKLHEMEDRTTLDAFPSILTIKNGKDDIEGAYVCIDRGATYRH